MDPASRALVQVLPAGVPDTFAARSEHSNVLISTLAHRRNGRSREEQARSQQYLSQEEEKGLIQFLPLMSNLGHPVRMKFICFLTFSIARQPSTKTQPIKPPGKDGLTSAQRVSQHLSRDFTSYAYILAIAMDLQYTISPFSVLGARQQKAHSSKSPLPQMLLNKLNTM
ncbi:Jerky -like [Pyrenophora seminiperda CCB06]|uniref:Jerky-like n=1 Tax=Pyrenophora seminiperda CCB06 TaxID=1302712 RepID=A0A3M7LVQ6_9PLEO|nr:Jerky -like [Pyrenophora seminiperda CCB06]